jgi:hypothetical protein
MGEMEKKHKHKIHICKMFDLSTYQCGCGLYFTEKQYLAYKKVKKRARNGI